METLELLLMNIQERKLLGEKIMHLRGQMSRRQFASEVLDCSYSALRSYEMGETVPNVETMEKICTLLKTDITSLLAEIRGALPPDQTVDYFLAKLVLLPPDQRVTLATELLNSVKHFSVA